MFFHSTNITSWEDTEHHAGIVSMVVYNNDKCEGESNAAVQVLSNTNKDNFIYLIVLKVLSS